MATYRVHLELLADIDEADDLAFRDDWMRMTMDQPTGQSTFPPGEVAEQMFEHAHHAIAEAWSRFQMDRQIIDTVNHLDPRVSFRMDGSSFGSA